MNLLLQTTERALISLTSDELLGLMNALNEVCNGVHIPDSEFETRLGASRHVLSELHSKLSSEVPPQLRAYEVVDVYAEPASLMVRAVSVFGDPVEMSTTEAMAFVDKLELAIKAAS